MRACFARSLTHDPRSHVAGTHQNARSNDYVQRVMRRAGLHFEEVLTRQSRELLQTGIKGAHAVKALETGVFPSHFLSRSDVVLSSETDLTLLCCLCPPSAPKPSDLIARVSQSRLWSSQRWPANSSVSVCVCTA